MRPSSIHPQSACVFRAHRARWSTLIVLVLAWLAGVPRAEAQSDVVLYASDVAVAQGNFRQAASSSGANQMMMASTNWGWTASSALSTPNDYFEATFSAQANTAYHVWLRMRGASNSKYNESVWVQFNDALSAGGSPIYRIGTSSALLVNLENCSGCGISEWGWQDDGYWTGQSPIVRFPTTGTHRIRVQIREDGVEVDQIVLSPSRYLSSAPGTIVNDNVIVPKTTTTALTQTTSSPFSGTPAAVPGLLQAEGFDNGGQGVAYWDADSANWGGIYRNEGVDISWASGGTGLVGWVSAGEWLKYTVNVQSTGTYTAEFLVASLGQGGVFHLEANGADVSGPITIPDTGGWQAWRTVSARVALNAGRQVLRLVMDRTGQNAVGNFDYFRLATASAPTSSPSTGSGGQLRVMTWNIHSGRDRSNNDVLWHQVRFMASQNPDVIILQEVSTWNGQQQTIIRDQLQSATGRTWYTSWAPSCVSGGCLGNLILSRLPLQSASMTFIPPTAAAQATVSVGGVAVTMFAAHLDVDPSVRTSELYQLLDWTRRFGGAKILGGDFNSWWGEWWIQYLVSNFGGDTWRDANGQQDGGYTIGNVRFDFLFRNGVTPLSCWVPYTELSDHRPVVADYRVP
ncbi:MAG: carbohydrate-binding protein [Vicinamibacterales bacterium]